MADFEYDVAFSFHQADQGLAQQLNDLLSDRFRTFIYTEQQMVLAGKDGEIAFGSVYGGKARVVVAFCRKAWGETPFTRIEETAIRGRAYKEGYDFTLFIPTEDPPYVPDYLPKTQLWLGLKHHGIQVAAGVVEHKIQTAGGEVRTESIVDRAARARRSSDLAVERKRFLNSDTGVEAAKAAYGETLEHLRAHVDQIKDTLPVMIAEKQGEMILHGLNGSAYVRFPLRYSNVLEGYPILVELYDGAPRTSWTMSMEEPRRRGKEQFQYALLGPERYGYYDVGRPSREFTPSELSEHVLGLYIDTSEKHPRR